MASSLMKAARFSLFSTPSQSLRRLVGVHGRLLSSGRLKRGSGILRILEFFRVPLQMFVFSRMWISSGLTVVLPVVRIIRILQDLFFISWIIRQGGGCNVHFFLGIIFISIILKGFELAWFYHLLASRNCN